MTALIFGDLDEVEFLLPTSRDAESRLRTQHRVKSLTTIPIAVSGRVLVDRATAQSSTSNANRGQILISFFYSMNLPGIPTLAWRRLAEIAGLGVDDRRIALLSILAGQRIGSAEALKEWWGRLDANKKGKGELIAHLLGLPGPQTVVKVSDAQLAKIVVDFCFGFRIGIENSTNDLVLSESCISALSRIWPEPDSRGNHDSAEVMSLLNRLVLSATTGPQRRLELGLPDALAFTPTGPKNLVAPG
jgi:hypothetical protein